MISRLKYIIPLAVIVIATSCKKDFLNINNDPNNPTDAPVDLLLTTAERTLGDALAMGGGDNGGLSQLLEVYVHRITTREEADQYGVKGNEFFTSLAWPKFYSTSPPPGESEPLHGILQNLEEITRKATADGNLYYRGIARALKAYTYSQLVDVFGDVPFSEANKLDDPENPITYPKFDDDAEIYPKLIDTLNAALDDLQAADGGAFQPAGDDVIYGGNIDNWIAAINTIKLKLFLQQRKVSDVSAQVNALLADPGSLISSTSQSFLMRYGTLGATDDRNPAFQEYFSTQRSNHISPWFYEIMKGRNSGINFNNPDPRIPYYWYNQLRRDTSSGTETYFEAPENQTEYRDDNFATIYFGSVGPDRDRNNQNTLSTLGIYPAGGRYDNGGGGALGSYEEVMHDWLENPIPENRPADGDGVDGPYGTGAAPYRFITYADRLYMEAELIQAGIATGNAREVLEAAIRESFATVDFVVGLVGPNQPVPSLTDDLSAEVDTYINKVLAEYDAGSDAKKMQVIMTQKWIQGFGNGVEAYNDYRRTGYPVAWDPSNNSMAPGGFAQPPSGGDPLQASQKPVPVLLATGYAYTLPWVQDELNTNPNAPDQKDPLTYKPFWMP
ncbi:MAG: SusD/RagB family nutrient-binding outer membrane lipoprotein [Chitinophagaceae bacterium]|nr:SusD/RagB family nutrient-binding outer membrane lipoprotein [Chitinophagaceae bacterium]